MSWVPEASVVSVGALVGSYASAHDPSLCSRSMTTSPVWASRSKLIGLLKVTVNVSGDRVSGVLGAGSVSVAVRLWFEPKLEVKSNAEADSTEMLEWIGSATADVESASRASSHSTLGRQQPV